MRQTTEFLISQTAGYLRRRTPLSYIALFLLSFGLAISGHAQLLPKAVVTAPDTGIASNFVIDILEHKNGVWLASGNGLNFSYDSGFTWLILNENVGLVSSNLSAMYSSPNGRLWVATNHNEVISGDIYSLSDGVSYSDDTGQTWTQVNFGPSGLNIPFVWGGDRTIYDITGKAGTTVNKDWLFFSAFAGEFLTSQDGGSHWRRIYASTDDSVQYNTPGQPPSLRNLYFSCATDTTHPDSLYVWAGSADGLFQYIFADSIVKPFARGVNQIAFCDQCSDSTNWVFYAADGGFMRGTKTGGPYITRFTTNGLQAPVVSAVTEFGGKLFVGVRSTVTGPSDGLAVSTNDGNSFTPQAAFTQFIGANKVISDFAVVRGRLYIAAQQAGLYVSADTGVSWTKLPVDLADTTLTNRRNVVNALTSLGDTLWVGTDSGLVTLFLNASGAVDSSRYHVFAENAGSSAKVIRVRTQVYGADSLAVWTVNRPLTGGGQPVIARSHDVRDTAFTLLRVGSQTRDINFFGDSALVVGGATGLYYGNVAGQEPSVRIDVKMIRSSIVVDSFTVDTVSTIKIKGDTIFLGAQKGIAWSTDHAHTWTIVRMNTDSLAADAVLHYDNSVFGITGDWFPVVATQTVPGDTSARVWTSSRRAYDGSDGIVLGGMFDLFSVDTLDDTTFLPPTRIWKTMYDNFAWNFSFDSATGRVFAATDNGLLVTNFSYDRDTIKTIEALSDFYNSPVVWDTIHLVDSTGAPLTLAGSEVYAVQAIPPYLWVGTSDRIVRMDLDSLNNMIAFNKVDTKSPPEEVFAFPVPFSHGRDQAMDFRLKLSADADVTIEVYDFAMNLVKRVVENYPLTEGTYPRSGYNRITWDGRNGSGEKVAVGVYYFKVSLSTGETRWGKLAIIP